ncbi:MAG: type II toxin-antitoxin system Phd/YefM family antitoxin [Acidobacteriia bacterium]|nr:type II toxin-antitoxin system Phd/YefM family antitoxin [Terriglobia bacterium]
MAITRHGEPVAAVVAAEDLERLERLRVAGPEGGLASIAGGWKGSEELVETIREIKRTRPRPSRSR